MAAIAHPTPHPRQVHIRPNLRVVRNVPRPSDAVYRRRRLGAVLLAASVVLAAAALTLSPSTTNASPAPVHSSTSVESVYVVQPGDTLWSIAQRAVPGHDVRPVVDDMVRTLGTATVVPGQSIDVPTP